MPDAEILSRLIKRSALLPLKEEYGRKKVELYEPQEPDSKATIRNLPEDAIVIKADKFHTDNIFRGKKGG